MLTIKRNLAALTTVVASALVLTGCGGGGGSSSGSGSSASTFSITAIDGYLQNAEVRADTDGDNDCDPDVIAETLEGGKANISINYQDKTICIKAIAGKTIDEDQGPVERTLELKAPAGETIVSPLTNLVVEQLEDDDSLTLEDAKNNVIEELGLDDVTADDVFGDFVAANKNGDDKGKAINIIAEILYEEEAKDSDLTLTEKLAIVKEVSENAQDAINSSDIDDFKPVISVANDGTVTSTTNSLPTVTGNASSAAREIDLGDLFSLSVANWFEDDDNEALTYELEIVSESDSTLVISAVSGSITGTPPAAGTYTIYVYARDAKGVRSYPAVFDLNVISPNTPPEIVDSVKNSIQSVIADLGLQQSIEVNETVSIDRLFTDADGDTLTITVNDKIAGLDIAYDNDQLIFSGTPKVNMPEVTASDLNGFLVGSSATDYRFMASLNEVEYANEGVLEVSLFDGDACMKVASGPDVCFAYSVADDLLTADGEIIQFLYVSPENAFAVPIDSDDLIAWSKAPFTNAGWTAAQLTDKTWYYVDDDSTTNDADPQMVEFAFGNNGTAVMVEEDGNTQNISWNVTNGVLSIGVDSGLKLNRLAATGKVVIANNTEHEIVGNNKPLIMTEDKNLATGIYLQWLESISVKSQQPQQ